MVDPKDGGMRSRKLLLTIGSMLLMTACWFLTAKYAALQVTFGEFLGGISGALGLFMVGNAASKHFISKAAIAGVAKPQKPAPKTPPKEEEEGVTEEGG